MYVCMYVPYPVWRTGAVKIDANAAMAKARYIAEQMEFISRNPGMQVGLAAGASYFAEELEINDYPFQVCFRTKPSFNLVSIYTYLSFYLHTF